MTLDEYQELAKRTLASRSGDLSNLSVMALGLASEAGEVADVIKKTTGQGHLFDPGKLLTELGDALYYISAMATCLGVGLDEVANGNIIKLQFRYPDGFSSKASQNR